MRKRLLAAALVLCMALAMLPVGALAAEKSITDFIKLSANMDEQPVPKRTYDIRYWWQDEVRKTLTSAERAELENKYKMDDWAGLIMEDDTCVGYYQAVKRSSSYSQEYMYYMPEELELTFETIKDGKQGVEALEGYIDISAYSDPDGDGIYDQRAAVGYGDGYYPVSTSEIGPLMGEINRKESSGISTIWYTEELYDMSGNLIWKYIPACELSLGMYYIKPKTVITGAEMKDLFGPDTIVEIEVCVGDIYGGSTTSAVYSFYIPGRSQTTEPLTINHSSASLTVGDTLELSVSGGDSTAKTVWKSSNEKVVSVNNGMITGVAPGTATVTATKGNGTATCQVTVPGLAMPQKVYLNYNDVKNSPYTLKATTYPTDLGVAWTSSDESVATVSGTGATANISVLKAGSTDISADFTVNGVQMCSTCRVYVIKPDDITLTKGKTSTISLDMSMFPQGATVKTTSMDTTVATVSGMKVTGVNPGQTKIKLEVVNGKETLAVLDCSATTRGVMITKQLNMDVGAEHTITAQSFPKIGYGVSWTSSDPDVVSVSNGKLTAKKVGTATITATQTMTGVPTPLSSKCVVTVKDPVAADVNKIIDEFIAYAESFKGKNKTGANNMGLGLTANSWCSDFIWCCARKKGMEEVFSSNAGVKGFYSEMKKLGAAYVSVPQRGDLVIFQKTSPVNEKYSHIGIVKNYDTSSKKMEIVHGNWAGKCQISTIPIDDYHYIYEGKNYRYATFDMFIRPHYSALAQARQKAGKINFDGDCPIEMKVSYNGEELNSSTGKWLTSFGTMWRDGEGVSFSIDYGNPYDYEITGTGTGTMDLEISYDTNDGVNTRKFLNVPITKTTTAYVFANNADMGVEMLVVDNAAKDDKIWYAEPNETVTAHNSELTESYNQQDQNGIDLPSSGSTGGGSSSGGSTVAKPEDKKPEETVKKASEIFSDVEAGSWYEEAVTFAVEKGLFKGVDETHFAPAVTTTRAMIMTVLARLDGHKADTYDEAVKWAVDSGVSDGSDINAVITREQFVTMLYRYAEQPEASGELTGFTDMTEVSDWAWVAMSWAADNGIIKGNEQSQLSPKAAATRAEAAAIMQRYITLIEK